MPWGEGQLSWSADQDKSGKPCLLRAKPTDLQGYEVKCHFHLQRPKRRAGWLDALLSGWERHLHTFASFGANSFRHSSTAGSRPQTCKVRQLLPESEISWRFIMLLLSDSLHLSWLFCRWYWAVKMYITVTFEPNEPIRNRTASVKYFCRPHLYTALHYAREMALFH